MKCLFLIAALCLASVLAQSDDCLTNSYTQFTVPKITALSTSTFSGLTTSDEINEALEALASIALASTTPFLQNIYVGASNGDFYMIKNCANQEGPNNYCTYNAPQYIAYVRNTDYFDDDVRHVFPVSSTGDVDIVFDDDTYPAETTTYDPTTRVWYTTFGWSDTTYASGGQGKTFSASFGSSLVAAADRTYREYCGTCLSNSYAVATAQALSVIDWSSYAAVSSQTQFSSIASKMKNVMDSIGSNYTVNGLLAFPNGDSYMVKYCNQQGGIGAPECSGHSFLFYVTNDAVFDDDDIRHIFDLSADGTVGTQLNTNGGNYDVTARSWFQIGNGWSDTYTFASSNATGRTYAVALNDVYYGPVPVVGADHVTAEPCSRAASCPQEISSSATSVSPVFFIAASAVIGSLFL